MSQELIFPEFDRRTLVKVATLGAAALAGTRFASLPVSAQDATPEAGPPPLPPGAVVVGHGLMGPRFLAVDTDGSVLVTEAGAGGDEQLFMPPAETGTPAADSTPAAPVPAGTRGHTGQVSRLAADGTQTVVASGIASYNAEGPVGPAGIALSDGKIWITVGGAGPATAFLQPLDTENSVLEIDPATGAATKIADIGAFERASNPDPFNIDSNLYGASLGPDGKFYVCDAGGNTVYKVDLTSGELSVVAVLAGIPVPDAMKASMPDGNPERKGAMEIDPVPTDVIVDADGTAWVTTLAGLAPGVAKVIKIAPDGTMSDAASGLSALVGIAKGPDGNIYLSSLSHNFFVSPPEAGQVLKLNADGTTEVVIDGLVTPNGITFDDQGNLYVCYMTVTQAPPGTPPVGQVLKFENIAQKM